LTVKEAEKLGIGPLETLLNERFEEFVTVAFGQAAQNSSFAQALNCIYPPDEFEKDFKRRLAQLNSSET
jgi:hypothetical protein